MEDIKQQLKEFILQEFLPGEDPNVIVAPNVMGHSVRFVFEGHDSPDCGGISEFRVLS